MARSSTRSLTAAAMAVLLAGTAHAQFTGAHLDPTVGRVGYHLDIGMLYPQGDAPRGNKGGPVSGTCGALWDNAAYSGDLPPGMQFVGTNPGSWSVFSGTPRQPGTWRGALSVEFHCTGGPDTSIYRRTLPVTWQIDP